jgi:hypothetical protein
LNAYLIFFIFTQGSTIKRTIQVGGAGSTRVQSGGEAPMTIQLGGESSDGKLPFPLMSKGERFTRYRTKSYILRERAQRHVSRGSDGHSESISDMTSVLHKSVSINAKGGYC